MERLLFDPDEGQCLPVEKWLKMIELFSKRCGFNEDQMFCFARGKLVGRAKCWLDGTAKVNNWCDFRREIQRTFCHEKTDKKFKIIVKEKVLHKKDFTNLEQLIHFMKATDKIVEITSKMCYREMDRLADDLELSILGEVLSGDEFPRNIININTIITNDLEKYLRNILLQNRSAVHTGVLDLGTSKTHVLVVNITSTQNNKNSKAVKPIPQLLLQQLLTSETIQTSKSKACNNWILQNDQPVLDLRELNSTSTQEPPDLIILEPLLISLPYFRYFTTLTFNGGHLQIPVQKSSRTHLTFATSLGTYQFCKAPKQFANTSTVFSKILIELVRKLRPGDAVVVFDELIVPSVTVEEGLLKLSSVLGALKAFGLTVNLRGSSFFSEELNLFQWRISYGKRSYEGLSWLGESVDKAVWQYLQKHNLCVSRGDAMQNLEYLDFQKDFEIHFIQGDNKLICILLQIREKEQSTVLGFFSNKLSRKNNKSSKTSAIIKSILHFKRFLVYKPFKIVTVIEWVSTVLTDYKHHYKYLEQLLPVQHLRFSVKE